MQLDLWNNMTDLWLCMWCNCRSSDQKWTFFRICNFSFGRPPDRNRQSMSILDISFKIHEQEPNLSQSHFQWDIRCTLESLTNPTCIFPIFGLCTFVRRFLFCISLCWNMLFEHICLVSVSAMTIITAITLLLLKRCNYHRQLHTARIC